MLEIELTEAADVLRALGEIGEEAPAVLTLDVEAADDFLGRTLEPAVRKLPVLCVEAVEDRWWVEEVVVETLDMDREEMVEVVRLVDTLDKLLAVEGRVLARDTGLELAVVFDLA